MLRLSIACCLTVLTVLLGVASAFAQTLERNAGPYNVKLLAGGTGFDRPLSDDAAIASASSRWTISTWLKVDAQSLGSVVVAAVGDLPDERSGLGWRGFVITDGELRFQFSTKQTLRSRQHLQTGRWYMALTAYDGSTARLFVDGQECDSLALQTTKITSTLHVAPLGTDAETSGPRHFGGSLAQLLIESRDVPRSNITARARTPPQFSLIVFETVGAGWPWQEHVWRGLQVPQDPWTLPKSRAALSTPVAAALTESAGLTADAQNSWKIGNWRLQEAPQVMATGEQISQPSFDASTWYAAIVPGTVLTTLIARGVYPDPDYGLNNMAIPESLSTHDYWYRTSFVAPANIEGEQFSINFNGINYAAEIWLNGQSIGVMRGAFVRGLFDVTNRLLPAQTNVLAARISPAPHPGIAHEQSILAGPGNNGGAMAIDGPTFFAAEGWDWIPGIRDRNTGLWQEVVLSRSRGLTIRDPHIVTHLPLPRTDQADISITVPIQNSRSVSVLATVEAKFDGIIVRKTQNVPPGMTSIEFTPEDAPALRIDRPSLWWPNGYGDAVLHDMRIEVREAGVLSDSTALRFGIREITYELSLFDHAGRLRRVEVDPTLASAAGETLVDVRHEAIKRTANGWAESLTDAAERSPAVRPIDTEALSPYLVIRVNNVPIAARGGNWGTDDSRKRISRQRLEPYFKLTRAAHLNIIRNWAGQNTEAVFYDLADEYGLLVLNDFWASTQDFQTEPQDPALFLANARDVISRYRNHPSIAVWFGRNEGVPQPIINEGLNALVASLDGTRYYTGSSNSINLQGSGPYNYRPPEGYFTDLASGFSVEVGTPSLSTLESLRASMAPEDLWPLSDAYAYHDWHFGGNGDVTTFMTELSTEFGAATSVEDFERKAQMLDYVSYRAIFEGFQAHLWTKNSGRLLWMTQPAWPSNTWQIYSSDYDTAAAYYAVMKACEPVHAQLNLPDFTLAVTNITQNAQPNLTLRTRVVSLDSKTLLERVDHVDAPANRVATVPGALELHPFLERENAVIVQLTLTDTLGQVLSTNTYWQGLDSASLRRLNALKPQAIDLRTRSTKDVAGRHVVIDVRNVGSQPVLNLKMTALDGSRRRVLPVSYSDNYLALLPGESRRIMLECPAQSGACARIAVRGWNVQPREVVLGTDAGA